MARISRGFTGRRRASVDPARVPPGQYVTDDFPVLSAGPTPHRPLESWSFTIRGAVDDPVSWSWEELRALVAAILGLDSVYPYADPLGALNLAVMGDGDELQWHFDQTDFVVSLALQDGEEGGDFEVAPFIRSPDEERYDDVARVLAGDREPLTVLPMTPGTLLVFAGRHSMHRVSPIHGATPRLVALFGYDTRPGTMSSELLKAVRYGRVA